MVGQRFLSSFYSLNPGYSKAIEGIQNVEKRNGSVDLDSDDDALDTNNAEVISLDEVRYHLGVLRNSKMMEHALDTNNAEVISLEEVSLSSRGTKG